MKNLLRAALAAACLLLPALGHADDCTAPKTRDEIRATVSNLGYDVKDEGNLIRIDVSDKYNYPVYFSPMGDQKSLAIFTVLETVPEDSFAHMPAVKILVFNDAHVNYLSLNRRDTALRFVLQNVIPSSTATPQSLRAQIKQLIEDANNSDDLWSPGKWK